MRQGDAFGELLEAVLDEDGAFGKVFEVLERDDGHVRVNDAARYLADSWGPLDDWVYERVSGSCIDIGCGAGRHSLRLQEEGISVLGIDVSSGAVAVCRRRGVRDVEVATVYDVDGRTFDTFLLLGNNLGLLGSQEESRRLLQRLAQLSSGPDAQILATGVGRQPGAVVSASDLEYERRNVERGRFRWQVTMRSRFLDVSTTWFDYLFITLDELEQLLQGSQWRIDDHLEEGPTFAVRLRRREPPGR